MLGHGFVHRILVSRIEHKRKRAVSSRMECANIYEIEKESFPYTPNFFTTGGKNG